MKPFCLGILSLLFFCFFVPVNAGIMAQQGTLEYSSDAQTITDLNTGRVYTSFDTYGVLYNDVLSSIAPGGSKEGWKLADSTIADQFVSALLAEPSNCIGPSEYRASCGQLQDWNDGKLGENFDSTFDYFMFLSTDETIGRPPNEVGFIGIDSFGDIVKGDNWNTIAIADNFAIHADTPANYLLYRDVQQVSEIPTIAIMLLGLMGILAVKSRRQL